MRTSAIADAALADAQRSALAEASRVSKPSLMMAASERQLSEVLSEFARTMLTDFPIQGILDQLVKQIVEIMPITGAGVTLISASTNPRYIAASDHSALRYEKLQNELGEGPCVAAFQTGMAVTIADLRDERGFPSFVPRAIEAGLAAVFTFPLCQGDKRLGALDLYRSTPGALSHEAMAVAQTLADVTSAYLLNAQARADLVTSSAYAHALALRDPLTGLPNRILLMQRIEHALDSRLRSHNDVAVLFMDLDNFKGVNDNSGHQVGDELLVAVGDRIKDLLRPGDTVARLSGDEFIVVCAELDSEAQVQGIATRLVDAMAAPFDLGRIVVDLSASIGIAFAGSGDDPEQLLHRADVAMYQVKRKGGGHHRLIDVSEQARTEDSDSLRRHLHQALAHHELRLEYQPVVRRADGRVNCVEALLRWDHPGRGPISPTVLIPLAEASGDIIEIGEWVLEQACIDRRRWESKTGEEPFVMAVNVSAFQLMAPGFVAMVADVIARTNTMPQHLCVEITESAFVQDADRALAVLTQLKQLGVAVALDDFGTGYSSLTHLKSFPVDLLKIDQSFIGDLTEDASSHAIVFKTIELAQLLDVAVVCEGVETKEQYSEVAALGSDYCQGYYFSRPMRAESVDRRVGDCGGAWTIAG
jgi:diguanylate cyclase (GGDEF)-like protein